MTNRPFDPVPVLQAPRSTDMSARLDIAREQWSRMGENMLASAAQMNGASLPLAAPFVARPARHSARASYSALRPAWQTYLSRW